MKQRVDLIGFLKRKGLAGAGIYLYFLPSYSPALNRIEPVFRQINHQEIPGRSYATRAEPRTAVEQGFADYGRSLLTRSQKDLHPAAWSGLRADCTQAED